jgi:hypothetical protein
MTETEFNRFIKMTNELEQLREEKKTWEKVCAYEKAKWVTAARLFPGLVSKEEREHIKNLKKLAGE